MTPKNQQHSEDDSLIGEILKLQEGENRAFQELAEEETRRNIETLARFLETNPLESPFGDDAEEEQT